MQGFRWPPVMALLVGLAAWFSTAVLALSPAPFSAAKSAQPPEPWRVIGLPERYSKPLTQFDMVEQNGSRVLRVLAEKSWGTLAHGYTPAHPISLQTTLKWRWRLTEPLPQADLSRKAAEDAALKMCVSFDMPADAIPAGERALFKLVQFFSRDKLPTATLCYVWASKETIGQSLPSPVTNRVRYIVVANSNTPRTDWQAMERNLHADFFKAFGHEASAVPALAAIIIGADSDNTAATSSGFVGDVSLQP